ncbi:PQQ-dependent sugar dehydrogenase [Maribrevibacterium harenarium]|uniref:PQQ-dependent sugar dehydrogenase n=1 Tax=Maribrevibacterium harenarium TaxID=2589817 RepID=A0A501WI47_9GAMM|nr:PQQ-dependent sugar dehydrogenase [Maribrevibacterium harenarium]TPE48462.1 PQQ-dependent sugar dehydrogenase [Maribrevibacterium harenarium]
MKLRLALISLLLTPLIALGNNEQPSQFVNIDQITRLDGIPWGMTQVDQEQLLATTLDGKLYRIWFNIGHVEPVTGLPAIARNGQGGLLDVAISPDFQQSSYLYFTYAKSVEEGYATTLARARLNGKQLENWQDLLVTTPASDSGHHFGSRITFDDKGHVFFGVGDRGERNNAQDPSNHAGSILRLKLDGSIPSDNPYVRHAHIRPEIWSYGHRNPQGLFYDKETHTLWESEHGPRGGDEINVIRPGANYGWPIVSFGKEYWAPIRVGEGTSKAGVNDPLKVYTPSIAPSALLRYQGSLFPDWRGSFLTTALAGQHLNRVVFKQDGTSEEFRYLRHLDERLRAIIELQDGSLVVSTDSGKLLRLTP